MPYDGGLSQAELEQRSEQVAGNVHGSLTLMSNFVDKVASWAAGRTDTELAQWIIDTDAGLDTKRFPDLAAVEVFVAELRALAGSLNTINTGVSVPDRASILKFA
jgi:hypothetical protein